MSELTILSGIKKEKHSINNMENYISIDTKYYFEESSQ